MSQPNRAMKEREARTAPSFYSIHRHGFVRVGVATPPVFIADPARNADAVIAQAIEADERSVDLVVFPELCLSAYAIDDLLLQDALLDAVEDSLAKVLKASATLRRVFLVGAPLRRNGRLYNCAVAIAGGRILGVVPKLFLPNYREYYEKRWFASGAGMTGLEIAVAGQTAPFGIDLLFEGVGLPDFVFHVEICEDYWAPTPPSTDGALAGALLLCNLSASNIVVGKSADRHLLSASQSMRCSAAYVYSAAGRGESTTDLSWDGQGTIYEAGDLIAQSSATSTSPGCGRSGCARPPSTTRRPCAAIPRPPFAASASTMRPCPGRRACTAPCGAFPMCRIRRSASTRTASRRSTSRSRGCGGVSRRRLATIW